MLTEARYGQNWGQMDDSSAGLLADPAIQLRSMTWLDGGIFQQAMNQGHSAAWDQLWDRAAGFYRQALDEFPDNPQALTSLGLALIELQEYDEALRCYQKAAKGLPDDPLPLEKIAQLCERMGNLERPHRLPCGRPSCI